MKRSGPIKRSAPPKRKTPLRRSSIKRTRPMAPTVNFGLLDQALKDAARVDAVPWTDAGATYQVGDKVITPDGTAAVCVSVGPRAVGPAIEKSARLRSKTWLADVRDQICEMRGCEETTMVDPHHVLVRGRRLDVFDITAIPLCRSHHDDAHAGRISRDELHRMLGAYLVRRLPQLAPSMLAVVLGEMLQGLGGAR